MEKIKIGKLYRLSFGTRTIVRIISKNVEEQTIGVQEFNTKTGGVDEDGYGVDVIRDTRPLTLARLDKAKFKCIKKIIEF